MTWHRRRPGAPAAALVVAMVFVMTSPALADPELPATAPEAVRVLGELNRTAERLTEEWLAARDALDVRRGEVARHRADAVKARGEAERAKGEIGVLRAQVDQFASSSFQGTRVNRFTALLASRSQRDFLDQMSFVELLSTRDAEAMDKLTAALDLAERSGRLAQEAEARAGRAERDAAKTEQEAAGRKKAMEQQIQRVKAQLDRLSASERRGLTGSGQTDYRAEIPAGSGIAGAAMQKALTQQGKPYVWGAEGPDSYDCSGLLYWSYQQLGVKLVRSSREQARLGTEVPRDQIQPGDFIAFYSPVSHIGIYVGSGKLVHAPQGGDVVKVATVNWKDVTAIRRFAR